MLLADYLYYKCAVLPKLLENPPCGGPFDLLESLGHVNLTADKSYSLPMLAEKER